MWLLRNGGPGTRLKGSGYVCQFVGICMKNATINLDWRNVADKAS